MNDNDGLIDSIFYTGIGMIIGQWLYDLFRPKKKQNRKI